jgi:hypothetical protein
VKFRPGTDILLASLDLTQTSAALGAKGAASAVAYDDSKIADGFRVQQPAEDVPWFVMA